MARGNRHVPAAYIASSTRGRGRGRTFQPPQPLDDASGWGLPSDWDTPPSNTWTNTNWQQPAEQTGKPTNRDISFIEKNQPSTTMTGAAFGETLHFITDIKLRELEKQRAAFATHAKILDDVKTTTDLTSKVEMLVQAIRAWSGSGSVKGQSKQVIGGKLDLEQLEVWIAQSKKDPCFSPSILEGWVHTLESHIKYNTTRFEYAQLFGKLLNEWIPSGDSVTGLDEPSTESAASEDFVNMGRKELVEQMERLQNLIFEPAEIDVPAFKFYLEELFTGVNGQDILKKVRDAMKVHSYELQRQPITVDTVRWTIDSALKSDLMSESKRATIREMASNPTIMEELASVLNMRLNDLEGWSWPDEGVEVEMRRALNGKYRAFTDPDIVDGLFLEYIGITWQIYFKKALLDILQSRAWKLSIPPIPRSILQSRRKFISTAHENFDTSIEVDRAKSRKEYFFMSQLAGDTKPGRREYDEQGAERSGLDSMPAIQIKQHLIHMLMADCHLNLALHKSHTVVRSDFEWFGPSIPHQTALTVLEFFGVSGVWLKFFQTFLSTPTRFKEDPAGTVRIRKRGTPINYAISQLLGEIPLFILDFAVNQNADGLYLHRLHDDFWFWDSRPERCEKAWAEVQRFIAFTGLSLNKEKTGSACVGGTLSTKLPQGDVQWGFLKFNAEKARFIISQEDVQTHIQELQRQLSATKSIFGWVNVYNKYMAFFRRNFGGRPPACFGRAHIDDIVDAFAYIQRELFPNHTGGAVGYLRSLIRTRMNVDDIPEGYFYFPITLGGLELRNPMIEAFALRPSNKDTQPKELQEPDELLEPTERFIKEMENDHIVYSEREAEWQSNHTDDDDKGSDEFLAFEEYVMYREQLLSNWCNLYDEMLCVPRPRTTTIPPVLRAMYAESTDFYGDWVVSLYGEGLVEKFGSLELVDASLIPVGMVNLLKTSKLKWDQ